MEVKVSFSRYPNPRRVETQILPDYPERENSAFLR